MMTMPRHHVRNSCKLSLSQSVSNHPDQKLPTVPQKMESLHEEECFLGPFVHEKTSDTLTGQVSFSIILP